MDKVKFEILPVKEWCQQTKSMIVRMNDNEMIDQRSRVMVLECDEFTVDTTPKQTMSIVVSI